MTVEAKVEVPSISKGGEIILQATRAQPGKLVLYADIWELIDGIGAYRPRISGNPEQRKTWFDLQVHYLNETLRRQGLPEVNAVSKLGLVFGDLNLNYLPQLVNNFATPIEGYGGKVIAGYRGIVRPNGPELELLSRLRENENRLITVAELGERNVKIIKRLIEKIGAPAEEQGGWQIATKVTRGDLAGFAWVNLAVAKGKPDYRSSFAGFNGLENFWVVGEDGSVQDLSAQEAFLLGLLVEQQGNYIGKKALVQLMTEGGMIESNNRHISLGTIWWSLRKKLEPGAAADSGTRLRSERKGPKIGAYGLF